MFTETDALHIAAMYYGMKGQVSRLPGEYDANFHLQTDDGRNFLLKLSHANESYDVVSLQNTVLQHIAAENPMFAAPRLMCALSGDVLVQHEHHFVRMFTFLPGILLAEVPHHSPQLLQSLGTALGNLCKTLQSVKHVSAQRYLKWDLKQSHWIHDHLSSLGNADDKACVDFFARRFQAHTALVLPTLRHSIIHGDVNDYNIVAADETRITGFIDFGDTVESATICELAIALAYIMMNKPDPLAAAAIVIKSFHAVFPLQDAEIEVLFDLICMRLCVSVVNSALRKLENPDDPYLVISEKPAWDLLRKFRDMNVQSVHDDFRKACGL